jgi:hypothetical protein
MTSLTVTKRDALTVVAAIIGAAGVMFALPSLAADAPAMGGGYTNVIPIPVSDPSVKEIAGALLKPQGAGPFPAIVYMPPVAGRTFLLSFSRRSS